jgi:predicted HTH transcriptional regulator
LFLGDNVVIQDHFPEIPAISYVDAEPRYTFRIQEQENLWEYYFVLFQRLRIYADNPLYIDNMGIGHEDNKQLDALREGLINMIIHCDYFSLMKPRIRVFTNRIEFENPGALPRPIKELMQEDVSIPRNPVLAKLFRIARLCENAGYGFDKMLAWKKETHKDVLFETSIDTTKVTFMLKDGKLDISESETTTRKQQENNQKTTRKQPENNQKTARKQQENNKKTTRKQQENSKKTTRKQQENNKKTTRKQDVIKNLIINVLNSNPAISTSEMAKQVSISYGSLRHHLEKMKSENLIKREGADKGGKWIIIK